MPGGSSISPTPLSSARTYSRSTSPRSFTLHTPKPNPMTVSRFEIAPTYPAVDDGREVVLSVGCVVTQPTMAAKTRRAAVEWVNLVARILQARTTHIARAARITTPGYAQNERAIPHGRDPRPAGGSSRFETPGKPRTWHPPRPTEAEAGPCARSSGA